MNGFGPILEAPPLVVVGWGVVFSVWATTISALALATWRIVRRRSPPRDQYRAAVVSLAAALSLSLVTPLVVIAAAATSVGHPSPIATSTGILIPEAGAVPGNSSVTPLANCPAGMTDLCASS